VSLEAEGIAVALREFAANIQMVFRIPCRFRCQGTRDGAPFTKPDVAIQLYRIVQEAVTNSLKHGKAKNISIHLSVVKGRLKLSVTDDGVGIADERPDGGLGLRIMNQRAHAIGAVLTIARRRRGGTLVTCSLGGKAVGRG
jgi:signal transduction histidine kinase